MTFEESVALLRPEKLEYINVMALREGDQIFINTSQGSTCSFTVDVEIANRTARRTRGESYAGYTVSGILMRHGDHAVAVNESVGEEPPVEFRDLEFNGRELLASLYQEVEVGSRAVFVFPESKYGLAGRYVRT